MPKKKPNEPSPRKSSARRKALVPGALAEAATPTRGADASAATQFPIVAIGASAGGLEAFTQFLIAMPSDAGIAIVLIQHLDPTHRSLAAELLAKHTRMPVIQIEDAMRVAPNTVYVIPPNRYLSISGATLHLTAPIERKGMRAPIDFFFSALAEDQQQRAIAIVLSGTGSDGALGAQEIKAGGGVVMAQAPETANYDGMPRSAIATGAVDYVLPIQAMPEALLRYVRHDYVGGGEPLPEEASADPPDPLSPIIGLLRARLKYDFSGYKKGTLTRRVQRRMGLRHVQDVATYVELLRQDPNEVQRLYKDLLIGVTCFFREPEAWQALDELVIEPLCKRARPVGPQQKAIRVWTVGCATGEEPYSLAMLLTEKLQDSDLGCDFNIFASDIDQDALAVARGGIYPETIESHVDAARLRRFFIEGDHTWRVNKALREAVVFAQQNVISDPPFSKLDLICCRNVLIYLEPEIQKKILDMFHFALREGGYLFLGNAETASQQSERFETVSRKYRIYRRVGNVLQDSLPLPITRAAAATEMPLEAPVRRPLHLIALAQQAVIQRFAPACAIVNHHAEVLYLSGPVDDYLQLPAGAPTHDVIGQARPGLRTKLRAALSQATREGQPVTIEEARVQRGTKYIPVRLSVEPLPPMEGATGLLLIAFEDAGAERRARVAYLEPPVADPNAVPETPGEYEAVIRHLDGELRRTRDELHSSIEELETSNEEFKAANEEVMSINEELQSTNEELETSKEELQSLNEELQTVNGQLEGKVGELEQTTNDLSNLLTSTDIATIFLDRRFRLRRFTPAATRVFRILSTDVGRRLADFSQYFIDDDLLLDAQRVLETLQPIEKEVLASVSALPNTAEGRTDDSASAWYSRRILPYRTADDRIDGVVITYTDITLRKEHQQALEMLNQELDLRVTARTAEVRRLSRVFQDAADPIIIEDLAGQILELNEETVRAYGWSREELLDGPAKTLVPPEHHRQIDELIQRCRGGQAVRNVESRRVAKNGRTTPALITLTLLSDRENGPSAIATLAKDLSELHEIQTLLAEQGDQDRQHLGRAVHDTLGQQISGMALLVATLRKQLSSGPSHEIVTKLATLAEEAKDQVRGFLKGLVPVDVDAAGLRVALEELAKETTRLHGLACRVEVIDAKPIPDVFTTTQLYLIAREAVLNAAKHSGASEVVVRLQGEPGTIRLSVCDNGRGLPSDLEPRATMGLRIMRHRAGLLGGILGLEPAPAGGTVVTCTLRLPPPPPRAAPRRKMKSSGAR